jgi:hypothetical protein
MMCGCSGASFQSSPDDAAGADAITEDAVSLDGAGATDAGATGIDAGAETGAPPDGGGPPDALPEIGVGETGPSCPSPGPSPTDLYVDKSASAAIANGTSACPFRTITAGLAAASMAPTVNTVHVAGGGGSLARYDETSSITVPNGLTLIGDGSPSTGIRGAGPCAGGITCAVNVAAGGSLIGFRVESPTATAIVTGDGFPAPVLKDVLATGAKQYGLYAVSSANLGPGFVANANGADGVYSAGTGTIHVFGGGAPNVFTGNGANGINMNAQAVLVLDEGSASENAFNGVRFGTTSSSLGNAITNLTAQSNKNNGVAAYAQQSLKLRGSTLVDNQYSGLYYAWPLSAVGGMPPPNLDIGTNTDPGNNVFGGTSGVNGKAGIYLCRPGPSIVAGEGDAWSSCKPSLTQQAFATCDTLPSSYVDVAYAPALLVPGAPVVASSCNVGP